MKIDFNNYEEWAMDYIAENLPRDIKLSFDLFLTQNPEIKSTIDSLIEDMPILECNTVIYPHKYRLVRGGKVFTLNSFIQYLSGAAVAAILLFGLFIFTKQQETSSALVLETIESTQEVKDENKQLASTDLELLQGLPTPIRVITREFLPTAKETSKSESTNTNGSDLDQALSNSVIVVSTDFEPLADNYNTIDGNIDLSTPTTLAYISDIEMTHATFETSFSDNLRQALASIIAPIDRLSPIKVYRTQTSHGIEIASRYRIGRE